MSLLFGGLLVLGSLTACGGGSDDEPEPQPTKVVTSVKVDYSATVSQQLREGAGGLQLARSGWSADTGRIHGVYARAVIVGHRDLSHDRDCPCFDAAREYADLQPK